MSRKFGLLIIFIAVFPILLVIFYPTPDISSDPFTISNTNKQQLINYSYQIFDQYFNNESESEINVEDITVENNHDYDILFITLLKDGKVRGCQSGSYPKESSNRLALDVKEATVECIQDTRFGGVLTEKEQYDVSIMFTFLYNATWMYNTSSVFLQNTIELGVHSLGIIHNDTPTIFKESVPISNNYDLTFTLQRLCEKANLVKNCIQNDSVTLFRYDTLTFYGNRNEKVIDLYRYNILIDTKDVSNELIKKSISSGLEWFLHSVNNETGRLEYMYYPSENTYSTDNNHVRQLASLWSITELKMFLNTSEADELIRNTLDYYLQFEHKKDNYSCLLIDDQAKLGNNAFIILSLLNTPEYPNQKDLLNRFAKGIVHLQQDNGSLNTYFFSNKNSGQDYYPGEALLALMKLYKQTNNETYLEIVNNAFPYYQQYWRQNKNTAFIPWHTQAYKLLYEETFHSDIPLFIFEMNDWIINKYQMNDSTYLDEIGGFPKYFPTFSSSVFLEGINDAYDIAKQVNDLEHVEKYKQALSIGSRFILQTQFTKNNSFYLEESSRAIGGFKTSLTDNSIRIDNTQHAVLALMKTYENEVFT